jgi:carboxymethylenebutenolidase
MILVVLSLVLAAPGPAAPRAGGTVNPVGAPGGRDTARVHIGPAGAGTEAFVAWPAGRAPAPAILVIHEWWGLNTQIRGIARRLAQEGYVAIVPDLYHGQVAGDAELAHELSRGLDEGRALADIEAAAAWLRAQPRVARDRLGVVGFCMGGRLSQLYALRTPTLAAAVMFYGRPETDPAALAGFRVPLQGHFGGEDRGIGREQVDGLEGALRKAGRSGEIFVYPGAGHAFMHDGRPSYHPDAARQAWARTLQFLQKHLKG